MEFAIKHNGMYESTVFSCNTVIQTESTASGIMLQAKIDDNNFADYQRIPSKNTVTKVTLPKNVKLKLVSVSPFSYSVPGLIPTYYNKTKIDDFLYDIEYGNIDYDYAYQYFTYPSTGGCSAIRNGKLFGRNFDWLYNNQVSFIVHTPKSAKRYAVMGVAGIIPNVLQSNVEQKKIIVDGVDMFKLVPFYLLDGINEHRVFCTHNIVPLDNEEEPTQVIPAQKEEIDRVCAPMLVRYILDKFKSAKEAVNYIRDYTTLFFPDEMIENGYQSHFMIGDSAETYIVEFIDGGMVIRKGNVMTNFNIDKVVFENDGTIKYPPTQFGMDKYGFGLERWDIITNRYGETSTVDGMWDVLDTVKYSNCYGEPYWCSELVKCTDDDGEKITVDTEPDKCTTIINTIRTSYANKDRNDPKVWITTHASVYDINKRILEIKNQEKDDVIFQFEFE